MQKTFALCAALVAVGLAASAQAQPITPYYPGGAYMYPGAGPALPPYEIITIVRSTGLLPLVPLALIGGVAVPLLWQSITSYAGLLVVLLWLGSALLIFVTLGAVTASRLYQLKDLMWRACRVVIDVGLHTGRMSIEDAAKIGLK